MVSSVIGQPTCVAAKLNAIVKICKYRRVHEGHHFISMAMEVHDTQVHRCIKECAHLFHNKQSRGHLSFFLHSIFQVACQYPITIRSQDLYANNIRGAVGENFLPQEGLALSFSLVLTGCCMSFGLFFCHPCDSSGH